MLSDDTQKEKNGEWQDLVDHCLDLYKEFGESEYRKQKIATIKKSHEVYNQKPANSNWPWANASSTTLPMHTITVDNLEPRLVSGVTGKKPVMSFQLEGLTEQDEPTKIIEDWFNDELDQVVKINNEVGTIVHKALLEGTVYPIATYDEDEVIRRDFVFDGNTGNIVVDPETGEAMTQDVTDAIFQGGKIEYADFQDVYTADDVDDWEKADVIRKIRPTYGELVRKKDDLGWMNIGKWLLDEAKVTELKEEDRSPAQFVVDVEKIGREVINCLECYVQYVYKKEDEEDKDVENWETEKYVAVIAEDSKVLIRLLPLREFNFKNEKPIKRIRMYKEPGVSYGNSIYEKIKSIQHGASDIFNMVINVANVTMIPWFMYTDSAGLDGEVVLQPGQGIRVDDTSSILFPRFSQNPRSYIVFIEMFMSLWEKLGSIGDIQIGRLSESRKDATATETMAAIQEGNIKHNYQSIAFKEDFLSLLRTIYDLYYQKMPYNKTHVYHGQPVMIPRMHMRRPYKFKLTGSTDLSNKVLEMQKNQQLYQMLIQNPVSDPTKLTVDLVESIKPDSDSKEYINPMIRQLLGALQSNPELPQVIQQYLQQKQATAQQTQMTQQNNQARIQGGSMADALIEKLMGQPQQAVVR